MDSEEYNRKEVKLLKKLNEFRGDLLKQDWSDDGTCIVGNKIKYRYVSADRVKENFGPLLVKHGLEMYFNFEDLTPRDPVGGFTQHWSVKATMYLIDVETGNQAYYCAYGEAGDSGDKGINKAQTDALKQIIFSSFMIADYEDADGEDAAEAKPRPVMKPQDEAKAEVMAQGEKPKAPTPKPKAEMPAQAVPTPKPRAPTPKPKLNISSINRAAINQILKNAKREVEDGTLTSGEYDALEAQAERVKDDNMAHDFIMDNQKGAE